MNRKDLSRVPNGDGVEQPMPGHWIGLRGRLAHPFWGWLGGWAVLCGALASNRLQWGGAALLNLVLVLLLAELAWASFWDLAVSIARLRPLADGWPPQRPASPATLPYTQPHAPAGRLARWLGRLIGWWQDTFWPAAGPALLGLLAATILALVLALFLPDRLRPLYVALVALTGLGVIQCRRDRQPLAVEALVRMGLGWLAGHAAFAGVGAASWVLALSFALAAWGNLRVAAGLSRGLWLLNTGQAMGVVVLLILKQPLAAGLAGLLLFGQVAMQPSLRYGGTSAHIAVARRTWPWLMAAMLLAGWALP